jgi:hypothetical protein
MSKLRFILGGIVGIVLLGAWTGTAFGAAGQVAYFSTVSGRTNLVNSDGTGAAVLSGSTFGNSLWWSPDRNRLALTQGRADQAYHSGLFVYDMVARKTVTVRAAGDYSSWVNFGSWAPSGVRLVYTLLADGWGYLADPVTGASTRLTVGSNFRWSPDGRKIAYDFNGKLWVKDYPGPGNTLIRDIALATGASRDDVSVAGWSPDQTKVYIRVGTALYAYLLSSKSLSPLPSARGELRDITSDGKTMLLDGDTGIYTYAPVTATMKRITPLQPAAFIVWHSSLSPAGTYATFEQFGWGLATKPRNIYVVSTTGTGIKWLAAGARPAFRPAYRTGVGAPSATGSPVHGVNFTASGFLWPRHGAGGNTVRVNCWHYEAGTWVYRKTVVCTNQDYASYTKYVGTFSLTYSGTWHLQPFHLADYAHPSVYGPIATVTVR